MNFRIATSTLLSVNEINAVLQMKDTNLEALFGDAYKIASENEKSAQAAINAAEAELRRAQEKCAKVVVAETEKLTAAQKVLAIASRLVR